MKNSYSITSAISVAAMLLAAASCGSGSSATKKDDPAKGGTAAAGFNLGDEVGTHEVKSLGGEERCYFGDTTMKMQNKGDALPGPQLLIRRAMAAGSMTVIEDQVQFTADKAPMRFVTTFVVADNGDFTFTEVNEHWVGTGKFLTGEPGAWNDWVQFTKLPPGTSVDTYGNFKEDVLSYGAGVKGADGALIFSSEGDLARIDAEECKQRFSRVGPPKKLF